MLAGYHDDLAGQSTRLTNRLRDALLHVHPALERLLGARLDRGGVLDQGKRHDAALICLARRRTDVLFAMHRDRRSYAPPTIRDTDPGLAAA